MATTILSQLILNTDQLLYNSLIEKFSVNQVNEITNSQKKWQWVSYVFIPVFIGVKTLVTASVLYIGIFFYSDTKFTFKQLFDLVVKAEFIFLGIGVFKIIWFYFFQTSYTLEDLQYFYPLSALNVVGYQGIETWFIYPLQVLNLFEVAYFLLLSFYIGKIATPSKKILENKYPVDFGLRIVATSYGSILLLWIIAVMFLTLNYS